MDEAQLLSEKIAGLSEGTPSAIMKILIDFGSYSELKLEERPKVFDDPYVAALLLDENHRVIGAHRKRAPQEIHAEPMAILDALKRLGTDPANQIIKKIETAYDEKSWLRSSQEVEAFEKLFKEAATAIRQENQISKIIVFSTLEPCKDYEAQPSCSCLLCAAGVDEVYYGADDTNPKGQGRVVLETGRLPGRENPVTKSPPKTMPNLLVAESFNANSLFYTVGAIVQEFFKGYDLGQSTNANAYSIFSIKDWGVVPSDVDENDRVFPLFARGDKPPIYTAALAELGMSVAKNPEKTQSEIDLLEKLKKIQSGSFDPYSVIVFRHPAQQKLVDILYERVDHRLAMPTSIISTHNFESLDNTLATLFESNGVDLYPHSFRKHYERYEAHKHVLLSDIREEYREHIFVLLKFAVPASDKNGSTLNLGLVEPYESHFARPLQIQSWLESRTRKPSRMTIYAGASQAKLATTLLADLKSDRRFRTGNLSEASVEIRIIDPRGPIDDRILGIVKQDISREQLANRASVHGEQALESLDAKMIAHLLTEVSISPTAFSRGFLSSLSRSVDWRDRRNAGLMLAAIVSKEIQLLAGLVTDKIADASDGLDEENWTSLCSYLNAIEDLPSTALNPPDKDIELSLLSVVGAIVHQIESDRTPTWLVDVVWRWLACWAKHATSATNFEAPFEAKAFRKFVECDPFLLSQLAFYVAVNSKSELVPKILSGIFEAIKPSEDSIISTATMLARTAFAFSEVKNGFPNAKMVFGEASEVLGPTSLRIFEDELSRCEVARRKRLGGVERAKTNAEKGRLFATIENLRTVIPAVRRKVPNLAPPEDQKGINRSWRGDQVKGAAATLTELSADTVEHAIRGLIRDPDIGTKWAGVTCTLGIGSKSLEDAIAPDGTKTQLHALRRVRRSLLLEALGQPKAHYWLIRETIANYRQKSEELAKQFIKTKSLKGDYALPSLSAFPAIRNIFEEDEINIHPEVLRELKRYRKSAKKIALVLPPIEFGEVALNTDQLLTQNEGSPPLGLGQIATTLSAHGHYVDLIDAHRFNYGLRPLSEQLLNYDIVGFSSVISTLSSIMDICTEISNIANDSRNKLVQPKIVLGGHAPTLLRGGMPRFRADYIVKGAGEEAMLAIACEQHLDLETYEAQTCSIEPQENLGSKQFSADRHSEEYAKLWQDLPWIERRHFKGATEAQPYEPAKTRDGRALELHVVMTRGCNWNCSFCTEALIGGNFGEMRRPVEDVISELQFGMSERRVSRVQFVDDNVLPSAPRGGKGGRSLMPSQIKWTEGFLENLSQIASSNSKFSWRGIMRLEDFLFYEEAIPNFETRLAESGCNLIAFGIESGDQKWRSKLKASETDILTNDHIESLMYRIKAVGIMSKAYFILGGPEQTLIDIESTINFSTSGAFDLAYFAIYKDFRELTRRKEKDIHSFDFDLYASRLDECLCDRGADLWNETLGDGIDAIARSKFTANYEKIRDIGFSFQKHIKYNDYHAEEGIYTDMGLRGSRDYLQKLSQAYVRFYCRDGWDEIYSRLLENGY